jgi:hypothetical protein
LPTAATCQPCNSFPDPCKPVTSAHAQDGKDEDYFRQLSLMGVTFQEGISG